MFLSRAFRAVRPSRRTPSPRPASRRACLQVESLERREVLSTAAPLAPPVAAPALLGPVAPPPGLSHAPVSGVGSRLAHPNQGIVNLINDAINRINKRDYTGARNDLAKAYAQSVNQQDVAGAVYCGWLYLYLGSEQAAVACYGQGVNFARNWAVYQPSVNNSGRDRQYGIAALKFAGDVYDQCMSHLKSSASTARVLRGSRDYAEEEYSRLSHENPPMVLDGSWKFTADGKGSIARFEIVQHGTSVQVSVIYANGWKDPRTVPGTFVNNNLVMGGESFGMWISLHFAADDSAHLHGSIDFFGYHGQMTLSRW
jgi:hypothetical protein